MTDFASLQAEIEQAFEARASLNAADLAALKPGINAVIQALERGQLRVAEPSDAGWITHQWIKKAVLLSFRTEQNSVMPSAPAPYYDKVPLRYERYGQEQFAAEGVRVVPGAVVRRGAHVARDVVLMPSFVNIGAYVGQGTMVDTWATVGSCAQIGAHVHLSGGVGIGGVLEPVQANPTIIEDGCFIGARSEVVEGFIVERGSVIGMGVFLGQSTRVFDRESGEIHYGRVPAYSVVVPGSLPSADGKYSLACAVIVKKVDEKTRSKVGINELLRNAD